MSCRGTGALMRSGPRGFTPTCLTTARSISQSLTSAMKVTGASRCRPGCFRRIWADAAKAVTAEVEKVSGVRGGVKGGRWRTPLAVPSTPSGYPHRAGQINHATGCTLADGLAADISPRHRRARHLVSQRQQTQTVSGLTVAGLLTGLRRLIWTRA